MPVGPDQINSPVVGVESVAYIQEYDPETDDFKVGSVEVTVNCTDRIHLKLPADQLRKPVACKFNPAAYMVPAMGEVGQLDLEALDFSNHDKLRAISGVPQIVTIKTSRDGVLLLTDTCRDWTPKVEVNHPKGDGESTVSATGMFRTYDSTPSTGSSS